MGQNGSSMDEDPHTQSEPIYATASASTSKISRRRGSAPVSSAKKAESRQRTERKLEGRAVRLVVEDSTELARQPEGLRIDVGAGKRLARPVKKEVTGPTLVPDSHGSSDSVHEHFKRSAVPVTRDERSQSFSVKRIPAPRPTSTLLDFPLHRSSSRKEKAPQMPCAHLDVSNVETATLSSHWSPSTVGEPSPTPDEAPRNHFRNSIISNLSSTRRHSRTSSRYSGIFGSTANSASPNGSPKFGLGLHKKKATSIRKRGPIVIVSAQRVASGRYSAIKDAGLAAATSRKTRNDSVQLSESEMIALTERRRSSGASVVSTARRMSVADAISQAKRRTKSVDILPSHTDEWIDMPPPPPPKSHKHTQSGTSSIAALENFVAASPKLTFPKSSVPEGVAAPIVAQRIPVGHPANHHARFKAKGRKGSVTALEPATRRSSKVAASTSEGEASALPPVGVAGGRRPSVNRIEHKRKLSNYRISIAQSNSESWTTTIFSEAGESMVDPLPIFPSALRKPTGNHMRHQSFPRSVSFASDYTTDSRESKMGSVGSLNGSSDAEPLNVAVSASATNEQTPSWKNYTLSPPRLSSASVPSVSSIQSEDLNAFPKPPPTADTRIRQSIPMTLNLAGTGFGSTSSSETSPTSLPSADLPDSPYSTSSFSTMDSVDDILIKRKSTDFDGLPDFETIEAQFESLVPSLLKSNGARSAGKDAVEELLTPKVRAPLSPVVHTIELRRTDPSPPAYNFVPEKRPSVSSLEAVTPIAKPQSLAARHQLRLNLSDFKLRPVPGSEGLQLPTGSTSTNLISPMSQPHMTSYFNPDLQPLASESSTGSGLCHWDFGPTVVVTPPVDEKRCFLDFGGPLIVTPPVNFDRRESYGMLVPALVVTPPVEERTSFFDPGPQKAIVVASVTPKTPSGLNEVTSLIQSFDFSMPESPLPPIMGNSPATTIALTERKVSIVSDSGFARAASLQQGKTASIRSSSFGQWGPSSFSPSGSPNSKTSGRRETVPCSSSTPSDEPRLREKRAATYDANMELRRGSRVGPEVSFGQGHKRGFNKVEIRSWLLEQRRDSTAIGPNGQVVL